MSRHEWPLSRPSKSRCLGRRRRARRRAGTASMLIIVALPTLFGVAALAIDLSLMGSAAQRVHHVTDAAALAGARYQCEAPGATAAVDAVVALNNAGSPWSVGCEARHYGPGEEIPGYGTLGPHEYATATTGNTRFDYCFARALGLQHIEITRTAVAAATVLHNRMGNRFIFAGATSPWFYGVVIEGAGNVIDGSVHSNTGVYLNGADMTVSGNIAYRNLYSRDGPNFTLGGTVGVGEVEPYPVDLVWEDFDTGAWDHEVSAVSLGTPGGSLQPGRWRVHGDMTVTGNGATCHDALFVVDGDVCVNASDVRFDRVTFVARGSILLNGSRSQFTPYQFDTIAFSTADTAVGSSDGAIKMYAASCQAEGILYAPNGHLYFDGSDEFAYQVGLIAETIRLIGSRTEHTGPESARSGEYHTDVRLVR